ncbi:hypothetical protein [Brevibacillus sp. NRS-1366]|uniref:capsular polysaccharide export protein, LipB/KpsS family n=1 Tax=Brevibacillus sp. NRS-1366 TaxID=3233899 RepID=UPI003D197AFD
MNDYMLNFHSLSIDFVEKFQSIQYNGIPLGLFYNFFYAVFGGGNTKSLLKEKSFRDQLGVKINREQEIQKRYDAIMDPIMNSSIKKPRQGKVLLYDYALAAHTFIHYLDPSKTFLLTNDNAMQTMAQFHVEKSEIKNELVRKAKKIFERCTAHPIFSNGGFQTSILDDHFPAICNLLIQGENLFNQVPISCVIVGTTMDPLSRVLCLAAAQKGIPSINMQHGTIVLEEAFMPAFATITAVLGNYEKEWYQRRGVAEHRLEITGHPRHDVIFSGPPASKEMFLHSVGLDPQKKIVLILSQEDVELTNLTYFIENLVLNVSPQILIKPHPSEYAFQSTHIYNTLLQLPGVRLTNEFFYHLVPHVDLVVVINNSTAGLEAMLANKPLLCLKRQKEDPSFIQDFYDGMGSFTDNIPGMLAEKAIKLLSNDSAANQEYQLRSNQFVSSRYPKKNATKELFDLIYRLTGASFINPDNRPPFYSYG